MLESEITREISRDTEISKIMIESEITGDTEIVRLC